MRFSSLSAVLASTFVGNFHSDASLTSSIYAFAESPEFSVSDRAAALRFLAVDCFGFDGVDAGAGVPDADYLNLYLADRGLPLVPRGTGS